MTKKRTITITNALTGTTRDVAVPGRHVEPKQAKPKSEGSTDVQRKS